jgi:hypothetical protein
LRKAAKGAGLAPAIHRKVISIVQAKSCGLIDVGRATKSFGRNADHEELATIYEYLTHPPQFLIRAVALRNSARRSCRKGVRGSRQPTSADLPHPQCNIAVEREVTRCAASPVG